MVLAKPHSDLETAGFGKRLDDERLLLAPVEVIYLMDRGVLALQKNGETVSLPEYIALAVETDRELVEKDKVYTELRSHDFTPRTGV